MSTSYIPPFAVLSAAVVTDPDGETVTMSKELFTMLLAGLADAAGFDASWYRIAYPDVAKAVGDGEVGSELQHFAEFGYQEGRTHRMMPVDDVWYRRNYPDIEQASRASDAMSAQEHYNRFGYFEGRASTAASEVEMLRWLDAVDRSAELVGGRVAALD